MTKKEVNLKVIKELNDKGYDVINMDFNLLNDFADILYKAMHYTRSCTQLLCVKSDGLLDITRGNKYVMIEEDETAYKLKNDIGKIRYYNKSLLKKT